MKIGAKVTICSDDVGENNVFASTDETCSTGERRWNGSEKEDGRDGGDGTRVKGRVGAVHGFDRLVMCGGFTLGDLAVACVEEDLGLFVEA